MTRQRSGRWRALLLGMAGVFATLSTPAATGGATPAYSAANLYDVANAYARAGKPGLAVLNYERARLLAPGDDDILANERHVRESVHLPDGPPGRVERVLTAIDPMTMAWVGLGGFLLIGGSLLTGRLSKRGAGWRWTAAAGGAAALALTVCQAAELWPSLHTGVVIDKSTPVLVSPVPLSDPLFVLPEAEIVRLLGEHEGYLLIRTRTGRTGWVSATSLVPVVPRRSGVIRFLPG